MISTIATAYRRIGRRIWTVFAFYVVVVPPLVGLAAWLLSPLEPFLTPRVGFGAEALKPIADALLGTSVTLLTVAISLMILVLSVTSQQISPRVLTEQLRQPLFRTATGFLFGCFATGAAALSGAYDVLLPPASEFILVGLCALLLFGAVLAFVGTIHYAASEIQINRILARLNAAAQDSIERWFARLEALPADIAAFEGEEGEPLLTRRSGYVERIEWVALVEAAESRNAYVRVLADEGAFNGLGAPVLRVIGADGFDEADWDALRACVQLSPDRAPEQHPYRALSVVADIALKGMSPGINDPTTAMTAIDYLSDLLVKTLSVPDDKAGLAGANGKAQVLRRTLEPRTAFDEAFRQVAHYCAGNDGMTAYLTRTVRRLALSGISEGGQAAALWFLDKRMGVEGPASEVRKDQSES